MDPTQNVQTDGGNGTSMYLHGLLAMLHYVTADILAALGSTKHLLHASSALASTNMLP